MNLDPSNSSDQANRLLLGRRDQKAPALATLAGIIHDSRQRRMMDLLRSIAWRSCSSLIMGLALSGCAWLIDYGEANSLEAYAEAVFRRQNHATSEMIDLANEDGAILGYDALLNAETTMRQACQPLNEYASRMESNQSSTLLQQSEVATSLHACDQATRQLEQLLDQID